VTRNPVVKQPTQVVRAGMARPAGQDDAATAFGEVEQLHLQLQREQRRAAEFEAQLAAMHRSTSWRITKPVRGLGQCLRWLRSGRAVGDLRVLGPRLLAALRHRGLVGVLRRLPLYLRNLPKMLRTAQRLSAADGAPCPVPVAGPAVDPVPPRLHPELLNLDALAALPEATVSVIIPTLNAGPEFVYLLRKLRTQTQVGQVEIVVVDSGSTDGTVAAARAAGARVLEIPPEQFSHSGARNLGAEHAQGDHLLFMVQDAYPLGERWLFGLLRYLKDHEPLGLVAVSCSEYCRDDSDMMYECSIATHYHFLGCKSHDRIGEFRGADHESLRVMGQLSNVACLIPRNRFQQYRFRGAFAEDLDLGVRLIRDGLRIAMLASVKVIHSHNRMAHYYLKRTFVSVTFLADAFDDFVLPPCPSAAGLVAGVVHVAQHVSAWLQAVPHMGAGANGMADATDEWLATLGRQTVRRAGSTEVLALGDQRVSALVAELASAANRHGSNADHGVASAFDSAARFFVDDFIMRFNHFNRYAAPIHDGAADRHRQAWADAAGKSFATSLGYALAVLCRDRRNRPAADDERRWLDDVALRLSAGV
jgi:O-antigen biosynthesis protein